MGRVDALTSLLWIKALFSVWSLSLVCPSFSTLFRDLGGCTLRLASVGSVVLWSWLGSVKRELSGTWRERKEMKTGF